MCVAIPSIVVEVGDSTATVERFGERLVVSTMLLPDPVELGDYVILQARRYAVEKIGAAEAQESLTLFREWLALADDCPSRLVEPPRAASNTGEQSEIPSRRAFLRGE